MVTIVFGNRRRASGISGADAVEETIQRRPRRDAMQRLDETGSKRVRRFERAAAAARSVRPFTRAHISRPFSELSVPVPDTKMNVIVGFRRARVVGGGERQVGRETRIVRFAHTADATPRQKKQASNGVNCVSTDE